MKFPGEASERVARALLSHGPQTAAELADALSLTTTAVRRQLGILVDGGFVVAHERAPYGPSPKRGRGRPGSVFSLTDEGRSACDAAYDDLALSALRHLAERYGDDAVTDFARERAQALAALLPAPGTGTPEDVAAALTAAGYAAEIQPLGDVAVQLCQHNCPIIDVAREFPSLCEEEPAALSQVLDLHVTRLATLAHGDEVCTSVIPQPPNSKPPNSTSRPSSTTRRKVSA